MKLYRSGDPNQRKPILKPLATPSKTRHAEHSRQADAQSQPATSRPQPISRDFGHSGHHEQQATPEFRDSESHTPPVPASRQPFASRRVALPVWLIGVLALAIIAAPVLTAVLMTGSSSDDDANVSAFQADPTATAVIEESLEEPLGDEIPLALDLDEMFDIRQWDEAPPSAVSDRQQYLLDSGVEPDFEMRYGASEVERLQAELEAIQRNSAVLRSLARQQSGDLTAAYSSLEATQEHSEGSLEDLESRVSDLAERIETVDEIARELRDLLGLPSTDSGSGGPIPDNIEEDPDPWLTLRSNIVAIEQWADELVFDLDEVNTTAQLRIAQIEQAQIEAERAAEREAEAQAAAPPAGIQSGPSVSADIAFYDSMPMGWPVEGPITSRYGYRNSPFSGEGGSTELHTGIDIAARTGTPVIATGGGTVQVSGDNGGYGLLVVIDHGRGVTTWYGHNSRLLVSPGQRVNAGDVIAEVGSTGRSTGPHVHYEVRVNGVPEDPLPYMQMTR